MASWNYIGQSAVVFVNSGNLALTEPLGTKAGDLMVACISMRDSVPFTLPSGWTLIDQKTGGNVVSSASNSIASGLMAWALRGASAPGLTFTRSGGSIAQGSILTFENQSGTPFDKVSATTMATGGTLMETPALASAEKNELLVLMAASPRWGTISGYTAVNDSSMVWTETLDTGSNTSPGVGLATAYAVKGNAGDTGALRATHSLSCQSVLMVAAFKCWASSAAEEQVSTFSSYAVLAPPDDKVSASTFSSYAVLAPPDDKVSASTFAAYAVLEPKRPMKRRIHNRVNHALWLEDDQIDPYFDEVSLLLSARGTAPKDFSKFNRVITAFGSAGLTQAAGKFGFRSFVIRSNFSSAANTDYFKVTMSPPAGDFTAEAWVCAMAQSVPNMSWLGPGDGNAGKNGSVQFGMNGVRKPSAYVYQGSYNGMPTTPGVFTFGQWHHVAVTRQGNVFRLFHDGVLQGQMTVTTTMTDFARIGHGNFIGDNTCWQGYLDELRITDRARYMASFTPPTRRFPLK